MNDTIRAWVPEPASPVRIRLTSVPPPTFGSKQIVVEVKAFSINRGETFLLEQPKQGWRPGKDVAGVIHAVGADVTEFHVGQRVVAHPEFGGWA